MDTYSSGHVDAVDQGETAEAIAEDLRELLDDICRLAGLTRADLRAILRRTAGYRRRVTTPAGPPDDWPELAGDPVMTNLDHSIDDAIAAVLRSSNVVSRHSAWNFNGLVWWQDGQFHERVSVHHAALETLSAPTLEGLMAAVNNRFGWD